MGAKTGVGEEVREFRLEIRKNVVDFFDFYKDDEEALQELYDQWGKAPEEIGKALNDITFYDITDLVRLNTAVEIVSKRLQNREQQRVEKATSTSETSIEVPTPPKPWEHIIHDTEPVADLDTMIEYIKDHRKRDTSVLFEIAELSGIDPKRLTDIVMGIDVAVSDINIVYQYMMMALEARETVAQHEFKEATMSSKSI